ncbi:MAG TPA: DUF5317 family protein [Chloroflexota bacterium]|nr:DUF5317 family protein [Chloroflexota bacterium]
MVVPFLAVATFFGVVVTLGARWRRRSFHFHFVLPRCPWLLLLTLALQTIWVRWLSYHGQSALSFAWILPLSYGPILVFAALNIKYAWIRVIALGAALNMAVMLLNGGTMPAPAGLGAHEVPAGTTVERLIPGSKDRAVRDDGAVALAPLIDRYIVTLPGGQQRLASIGDFVALAGAFLGLLSAISVQRGGTSYDAERARGHLRLPG